MTHTSFSSYVRASALLCASALLLCSCSTTKTPDTQQPNVATVNAVNAIQMVTAAVSRGLESFTRPTAPLGLFAGLYLSQSGFLPVRGALTGVQGQSKFTAPLNPGTDAETFSLLQEFGSVLKVNIPDMLNRSSNRADTLNQYVGGLANITVRAQRKSEELNGAISQLQTDERAAQSVVTQYQRAVSQAMKDQDYAGAAVQQQSLGDAQTKLSVIQNKLKLTQTIFNTYKQLLDISAKRSDAISKNREVLVAGLGVVNVPGIEDLGILQQVNGRGGSFFQ